MSGLVVTSVRLAPAAAAGDLKRVHDVILQAALAGELPRPVLWAQPAPRLLVVRHDRPLTRGDFPAGWADALSHRPYWLPPEGGVVDWAVTVDATQSGQSHGQYAREVEDVHAGRHPTRFTVRGSRKARTVRTPERMLELVTDRLAPFLAVTDASASGRRHRVGRRPKEAGRIMHSNQVMLRGTGTVLDAPGLHTLMVEGVGRHRAFGCGLILARPTVAGVAAC